MPPGSHQLVFGLWQFEGLYECLLRCITQTHTCWFMLSDRLWNPEAYYLSANSIRSQCCEPTQWDAWLMQPHKQASEKFKRMAWVNFHTMNFLETAFFSTFFFFFYLSKNVTSTAEFENRKIRSPWVFMHFWWQFKVAPVGNVLALEHWHVFLTSDVAAWSRPTPSASWCWTLTLLVSHSRNKRLLCSAANHLPCVW